MEKPSKKFKDRRTIAALIVFAGLLASIGIYYNAQENPLAKIGIVMGKFHDQEIYHESFNFADQIEKRKTPKLNYLDLNGGFIKIDCNYYKKNGRVFYSLENFSFSSQEPHMTLVPADLQTFEPIFGHSRCTEYARDKRLIFYKDEPLYDIDRQTFTILGNNLPRDIFFSDDSFTMDKTGIYINTRLYKEYAPGDVEYFKNENNGHYRQYVRIDDLILELSDDGQEKSVIAFIKDPGSFENLGHGYIKDKYQIYKIYRNYNNEDYFKKIYNDIDPQTVNFPGYSCGKYITDKDSIWFEFDQGGYGSDDELTKLEGVDIQNFKTVTCPLMTDSKNYYVGSQKLDLDYKNTTVDYPYVYDYTNVYSIVSVITSWARLMNNSEEFDRDTFQILDELLSRDHDTIFVAGYPDDKLDIETFEHLGSCGYVRDKNGIWSNHLDWPPERLVQVHGADPETFTVAEGCYAYDKSHYYYGSFKRTLDNWRKE